MKPHPTLLDVPTCECGCRGFRTPPSLALPRYRVSIPSRGMIVRPSTSLSLARRRPQRLSGACRSSRCVMKSRRCQLRCHACGARAVKSTSHSCSVPVRRAAPRLMIRVVCDMCRPLCFRQLLYPNFVVGEVTCFMCIRCFCIAPTVAVSAVCAHDVGAANCSNKQTFHSPGCRT